MRFVIMCPKDMGIDTIVSECALKGGKNVKVAPKLRQVFCDMEEGGANAIANIPGVKVRKSKVYRTNLRNRLEPPNEPGVWKQDESSIMQPVYAASQASIFTTLYELRDAFSPPITGAGATVAILDTGIMSGHRGIGDKVVHNTNFSDSGTYEDLFDHGTGVAYVCAGGQHAPNTESGIAPGAYLMNIKVIGDDGIGSDESVVMGLEHVAELTADAIAAGKSRLDPERPNAISMSFGAEEPYDEEDPVILACKEIWDEFGHELNMVAAAGNSGPGPDTITIPASSPHVMAVGAITISPFLIWEGSSRGPTNDGRIKPEIVMPGINILTASAAGVDAFTVKSGTSFAAPMAAGLECLLGESSTRFGFADAMVGMSIEEWNMLLTIIGAKPEGMPMGLDNSYGAGVPVGEKFLNVLGVSGGLDTSTLMSGVLSMAMVGMMTGMMKGM